MVLVPLTHTLSKAQFNSTHHLLKSTSTRSAKRFRRQLSLPLSPGSDYTLSFNLGPQAQAQPITLYMDTGSDLVWFPCAPFKCILCEGKPNEPNASPPTTRSVAVSCKSPACSAAHNLAPPSDLCAAARCPLESIETSDCANFKCPPFYYAYGDGSLIARLYRDTLSLSSLFLRNFTFGCAYTTLAEPTGVAGFGRGLLSLPAQLATLSPQLGNRFSYCLVSHSFDSERVRKPSPLILGRYEEKEKEKIGGGVAEFVYTSMLENPKHPYFYTVSLIGIAVGKRTIPAPEMLRRIEEKTGLAPCYYLNSVADVPALTLRFAGGKNSSVVLPRKNYFYEFSDGSDGAKGKRKVGCLMLMNGGDEADLSGGPGATLGNYQQQGFEVEYDLEEKRVGFARRQCALLWERLNRDKN
ncbi:Aspartic proteinase nepenthesin-1 [Glycine soja]|nr:Aspartic proteinase nepenthesin-1 [Glycine soja]